jgi:hypothetical protein
MRFERAFPFVIAVLGVAVIGPALWSGWLGDDALYSSLDGMLGADRISLWQAMLQSFDLWFGLGRFYPGQIVEKYLVFYFFTNLIAYKVLLIAATLATVELFRRCVAAYASPALGNLAAVIAISLLVERAYHDAILSYNANLQVVAILVLGSMLAFRRVLEGRRGMLRIAAIVMYALAALTYEDAYGFCLLYLGLAASVTQSWRQGLRLSWPYLAIAAGLTIFSIAMRLAVHLPTSSPYTSNLDPSVVLRTFVDQATAALPLAYWAFDPQRIFSRANWQSFYNDAPLQPLVFVAFALAAGYSLVRARREPVNPRNATLAGLFIVFLAAAPIAITVKYQHELQLGLGYLPVLYEVFGVALALAAIAAWSARLLGNRWLLTGWITAIALIATMTQATNVRIARGAAVARATRSILEQQLDIGLLRGVATDTAIGIVEMPDWMALDNRGPDGTSTRDLLFMHSGKRVEVVSANDPRAAFLLRYDSSAHQWQLMPRSP